MGTGLASALSNHFLIAMPGMADSNFHGTVIFIAEHDERGALGIVVNRPLELDLGELFERIDVRLHPRGLASWPVYYGGPVQTDRGFVLHQPQGDWTSTVAIGDAISLTSSKDILEAVGAGDGPARLLVSLGYAGWGPGQLEDEVARNAWLTVAAQPELIFDVPADERFPAAFALLGIDPSRLSGAAGHA